MSSKSKKQHKRESKMEQVWKEISFQDSESNTDELFFTKLFARNRVHIEKLYKQAERNCRVTQLLTVFFGVFGAAFATIIIWLAKTTATTYLVTITRQLEVDKNCVYIAVLGMILLEIIAGLCIWANYGSRRQMEHYYDTLYDNEQFLLSLEIAAKVENADPDLKGEFYKRILEGEIRRREKVVDLYKRKKT